jgi:hypothetical protein
MRITIKRTGGFAGIEDDLGSVDLGEESRPEVAIALQNLARQLEGNFSPGADRLHYEIEIQESGKPPRRLIVLADGEPDLPEMRALEALFTALGLTVV